MRARPQDESDEVPEAHPIGRDGALESTVHAPEPRHERPAGRIPTQRSTESERAELSDRALLAAHAAGDERAFDEIVRRHWGRLLRTARAIVRDQDDAEDAVQVGLVKAARNAYKFRGDSSVTTWLHRIVSNAAIDSVMKSRREVHLDPHTLADLETQRAPDAALELGLAIESALQALPREQRDAWVLVCQLGFSQREAAELMAAPHGTVKSWVARSRMSLADHIFGSQ